MNAYVFPGQGAQFVGMGKDLYDNNPLAKEMFEKANEILGFRITDLMFAGTDEDLKQTKVTQPAIFLHSVILAKTMGEEFKPDMVAGHSLGEFSALVAAGALSFVESSVSAGALSSVESSAFAKALSFVESFVSAGALLFVEASVSDGTLVFVAASVSPGVLLFVEAAVFDGALAFVEVFSAFSETEPVFSVSVSAVVSLIIVSLSVSGAFFCVFGDASACREAFASVVRSRDSAPSYMRTVAAVTAEIRISRFARFIDTLAFLNGRIRCCLMPSYNKWYEK